MPINKTSAKHKLFYLIPTTTTGSMYDLSQLNILGSEGIASLRQLNKFVQLVGERAGIEMHFGLFPKAMYRLYGTYSVLKFCL